MVNPSHSETKFKIVSEGGSGIDDVNIVVTYFKDLKNVLPEEYVKTIPSVSEFTKLMRKQFPDYRIMESGTTYLSSQPASYHISEMTHRMLGIEIPFKQYQVFTIRIGYVYTITCRTDPARFDSMLPIFKLIASRFVIKPSF